MLDGWEMQVKSTEGNTNSHSLWVAVSTWDRPGCTESTSNSCLMEPGGYVWINWLGGFELQKKYEVHEMNLSGFDLPGNTLCDGCKGRWALDPCSIRSKMIPMTSTTIHLQTVQNLLRIGTPTRLMMIRMGTCCRMDGRSNTPTKLSTTISSTMQQLALTVLVV